MAFTDLTYFFFLAIGFLTYFLIPARFRFIHLALFSMIFILSFSSTFLLFTLSFVIINYFLGIILGNQTDPSKKRIVYNIAILFNIGSLVYFKYFEFLLENILHLADSIFQLSLVNYSVSIFIPLGISFYTFTAIGYLVDINKGFTKPEKDPVKFLIFIIFFPKFVSGPVERSANFLKQLKSDVAFSYNGTIEGMQLILFGLFKKVVIADRLANVIFPVYNNLTDYSGISIVFTFILQTIFLYCDFSGYTDIALGSARIFGFKLIDNFNRPLFATSVGEFWRRWHISLSSWCSDYIYKPVMFKRRKWGNIASGYAVFITFIVIGIWHGPRWNYLFLGLLQGIAINYEFFTRRIRVNLFKNLNPFINNILSRILVYLFFSFTLIFFFSESFNDVRLFIKSMLTESKGSTHFYHLIFLKDWILALGGFFIIFLFETLAEQGINLKNYLNVSPRFIRWSFYYIELLLIIYSFQDNLTFFYQQF